MKTVSNTAQDAAKTVSNTAQDAAKTVSNTAQDAAKIAADAAKTTGDAVVDAAKAVSKQLVVTVHFLEDNVPGFQFVVNQAKHAAMAIKAVIEMVEVAVEKFVEWVRFIFEWGDIKQTQKVIANSVRNGLKGMSQGAIKIKNSIDKVIEQLKQQVVKAQSTAAINSTTQASSPTSHSSTEKFEWFMDLLSKHSKNAKSDSANTSSSSSSAGAQFVADLKRAVGNIGKDLFGIEKSIDRLGQALAQGDVSAAFSAAKDIALQLVTLGLDVVRAVVDVLLDSVAAIIDGVLALLTTKIRIPYISDLLKKYLGIGEMSALEALLYSAAVIDGGRNVVRILRGLDWLRGSGVRVLGMALGIAGRNPVFWTLLEALRAEGVLTICPIGNDGYARPHAPALYPGVLAVGAASEQSRLAPYTGCELADGECLKPEVLAPGVDIRSATPHQARGTLEGGTSQACAFTAGVACLLFQAYPNATSNEVAEAICASATAIDDARGQRYRFGLIQPGLALEFLQRKALRPRTGEPAGSEPPFYRDEELLDECRDASAEARLHCVVVSSERGPVDSARGAAGPVVDRVAAALGEPPESVEYLPTGRIGIVSASPRFIVALGRDPDVQVLSGATVRNGRTLF